ncbi:MAG TPA: MFS transporter [Candidatus Limnocylindrales bacterium]|nr:MFS transporter [Candidatus Limnocylindrales bacterium]
MSEDLSDQQVRPDRLAPWASLQFRQFNYLFVLALFATTAQQMRQAQIFYQVYELSGSAFQLGMTGVAQGLPIFVFGLFGGALADFMDRKQIILITTLGNWLVAVLLGVLTVSGLIQVWHIQVGMALTSTVNIVLTPTRMSIISFLVPRTHITNAVSLNSAVSQCSHFIGPMLGGLSLAWMSTGNAYLFNALFYIPAVAAIVFMKIPALAGKLPEKFSLASMLGGFKFLISEPLVFAMVILDFITTGFGYFRPLLPVFAKDILFVGPAGFGVLSSAPAIGGVIGTAMVLVIGDVKRKGLLVLWSFLAYAVAVGVFGLSTNFLLSLVLLAVTGLANSLQAVMRQTTFHLFTPDQVRGRAFAVFHMFSQGANGFGATEIGFVAALLGAPGALLFGCAIGSLLTLGCWVGMPGLRKFGTENYRR